MQSISGLTGKKTARAEGEVRSVLVPHCERKKLKKYRRRGGRKRKRTKKKGEEERKKNCRTVGTR